MDRRINLFSAAAAALAISSSSFAQTYPSKPVRLVGEFAAGSIGDTLLRIVVTGLAPVMGQPVVIDNRAGGGGAVAAEAVKNAAPDGYTILGATSNVFVVRVHLAKSNPFDIARDFTPLTTMTEPTVVVVANPSFPASNLKELIEFAKKNPGKVSYASSGIGSTHHLSGEQISMLAGIDMVHVPYKALAQAMGDVVSGQVPVAFNLSGPSMPLVKAGKVKVIAIVNAKRFAALPDVATVAETLPGFEMAPTWTALFAPGGMPAALASRISTDAIKAMNIPEVRSKMVEAGFVVLGGTPEELAAMIRRQTDLVGRIVKAAGIPQTE
jgi:tripartite-type tricarboxylate transporter receptor subunit TctC